MMMEKKYQFIPQDLTIDKVVIHSKEKETIIVKTLEGLAINRLFAHKRFSIFKN